MRQTKPTKQTEQTKLTEEQYQYHRDHSPGYPLLKSVNEIIGEIENGLSNRENTNLNIGLATLASIIVKYLIDIKGIENETLKNTMEEFVLFIIEYGWTGVFGLCGIALFISILYAGIMWGDK